MIFNFALNLFSFFQNVLTKVGQMDCPRLSLIILGPNEKKGGLGMVILESASVTDTGVPLWKPLPFSEGESTLILTVDGIFSNLEQQIYNGYGKKYIERVVDKVLELILASQPSLKGLLNEKTIQLDSDEEKFDIET